MTTPHSHIKSLLSQQEGIYLEFKTCAKQLNRDVYETVCAFLNRHGGTLLLGVKDSGVVSGVDTDAIAQIKKDFTNTVNNDRRVFQGDSPGGRTRFRYAETHTLWQSIWRRRSRVDRGRYFPHGHSCPGVWSGRAEWGTSKRRRPKCAPSWR
ncbi:MAG: ATP-binding protein [Synergistaceae bacterium]|nr:ATP-binding protein [Synergistaceae bacterium]